MPRKPLDPRIPALVSESVKKNNRSIFVLVGSSKQQNSQITNLHYLLSQSRLQHSSSKAERPNVLWCYKKDLGFSSNRTKRESKIKRDIKRGVRDEGDLDPFELFLGVTDIRYCYYKETSSILGQTFGMVILQDFEALTPNLLARTIETAQGGGIVVFLLSGLSSLKRLYSLSMDVHSRYRTESSGTPVARFNERFILSLGSCGSCLVLDDELNVLPISSDVAVSPDSSSTTTSTDLKSKSELQELKTSVSEVLPTGAVVELARTHDQAHALLTFADAIVSKTLSSTVALTAARGRGKSACLGLAIALAVAHGYANIFVTSPSPDNLSTVFDFLFKGLQALGYSEHLDWDVARSMHEHWRGAIVRVNIFRDHRQTVQYIQPQDAHVLGQAELVIIDEAAAIPLPLVKSLLGPYLVFMSSTINGYEGTGRSLSLKLIKQLRETSTFSSTSSSVQGPGNQSQSNGDTNGARLSARTLKEIRLEEPIRYAIDDPIEKWLNTLLCLDVGLGSSKRFFSVSGISEDSSVHPSQCDLYQVSRDTLFSFHPASELFLQRIMALYVSSHYKNSPDDLQLLSDAPNHSLFVLLPPLASGKRDSGKKTSAERLPEPLAVIQVAFEGKISKQSIYNNLGRGQRAGGDLIPWTLSQQFQDDEFATLSGARIVRIAVHPHYMKMGYGSRALDLLSKFYSGQLLNLSEDMPSKHHREEIKSRTRETDLHNETVKIRDVATMEPLLQQVADVPVQRLDYLGTSFGLSGELFKFWKRSGYIPLYIRQTKNSLTGEHTCIMVKSLHEQQETVHWLKAFAKDFRKRYLTLLSFSFKDFTPSTALYILEASRVGMDPNVDSLTFNEARNAISPFDQKRLQSYANNMIDYHAILDLLPPLTSLYFNDRFPDDIKLSKLQCSILLAIGAQHKSVEDVENDLGIVVSQVLALLTKIVRKLAKTIEDVEKGELGASIPTIPDTRVSQDSRSMEVAVGSIENELEEEGDAVTQQLRGQQQEVVNSLDLDQYAISEDTEKWQEAEAQIATSLSSSGTVARPSVVSIKGTTSTKDSGHERKSEKKQKRKYSDGNGEKSMKHKKR